MRSLIPWNKNRGEVSRVDDNVSPLFALHREMNRMFDDFMRTFDIPTRASSSWPNIEVSETGDDINVVAEVPGLDKGDVEVTLHDGVLMLRGEKFAGARDREGYTLEVRRALDGKTAPEVIAAVDETVAQSTANAADRMFDLKRRIQGM